VEETEEDPEEEPELITHPDKKKVSPKGKRSNTIKKNKNKSYSYKDLIYHLEFDCPRNKIYTCP
jgi:hypothetical protein